MTYLTLRPEVRFVRGPRRSALYDLGHKRIWPLDEWASRLVGESLSGQPVERVLAALGVCQPAPRRLVLKALLEHPLLVVSEKPAPAGESPAQRGSPGGRDSHQFQSETVSAAASAGGVASTDFRLPLLQAGGGSTPSGSVPRSRVGPGVAAPRRLEFLWLELTERCNLRCVHCYAGSGPGQKDGPMRTEDRLRVLREAAAAGCRRVQFNGGEALLDADLPLLVEESRALGFGWIEVYSNATLLDPQRVRFLRQHGVCVAVSFYSHRAHVHEAITRVPGSFGRTVAGIRSLVDEGVPVRAGIIRMRLNQDDVEGATNLLVSLGVPRKSIAVDEVRPVGRGCGDSLLPSGGNTRMTSPPTGAYVQREGDGTMGCRTCWSGKIAVAPSGEVYPCIFSRELPSGNVLQDALQAVIEGEALQDLWSIDKAQIPVCRDCEFRYGCFDCRALALKQTGQLRSKPPSCTYDPHAGMWAPSSEAEAAPADESCVPVRGQGLRWAMAGDLGLLYSRARQALVTVNRVAAEVIRLSDGRRTLQRIARDLARRYRAPEARVRNDVRALAAQLARMGLLELRCA